MRKQSKVVKTISDAREIKELKRKSASVTHGSSSTNMNDRERARAKRNKLRNTKKSISRSPIAASRDDTRQHITLKGKKSLGSRTNLRVELKDRYSGNVV